MKIGFTGTRHGMSPTQMKKVRDILSQHVPFTFLHGDCVGADSEAHDIVRELSIENNITIFPPKKSDLRANKQGNVVKTPLSYQSRDRKIVENCDLLIGVPKEDSKGTWYTITYAKQIGKKVIIIYENGEIK